MRRALRRTLVCVPALLVAAVGAAGAAADTVLLKDGRTLECKATAREADGRWRLGFVNGEIHLPADLVKDVLVEGAQGYEPKNDEERAQVAKGLVPYEGKWLPKDRKSVV